MPRSFNFWTRKLHRWGALICCLPLLLVILTGLLLQLKKQVAWVQPPTMDAGHSRLVISWDRILESARSDSRAAIGDWSDIDRLDVRPSRGLVKIRANNDWELQLDLQDGTILSSRYRRSDLIESLHDGSYFGDVSKLIVFLLNGIVLLGLWLSGLWLWYLPIRVKRQKQRKRTVAGGTPRASAET
jgi:uncharacterized iron-regulated membrane protein